METEFIDPFDRLAQLENWASHVSDLIKNTSSQTMQNADATRQISEGMVEIARAVDTLIKEVTRLNHRIRELENEIKKP
jgi:methyl-accepting chemotaxis protein